MGNRYGLPESEVERVRRRDTHCVYCHKKVFTPAPDTKREDWATIEHLNRLPPWNNPETIAICCASCNSSRGNASKKRFLARRPWCMLGPNRIMKTEVEFTATMFKPITLRVKKNEFSLAQAEQVRVHP